jgi:hypothetical protein
LIYESFPIALEIQFATINEEKLSFNIFSVELFLLHISLILHFLLSFLKNLMRSVAERNDIGTKGRKKSGKELSASFIAVFLISPKSTTQPNNETKIFRLMNSL